MVRLEGMDEWERMVADYGLLGLSPSYHPLGLLRGRLPSDVLTAAQLKAVPDGTRVRTAGLIACRQRPGTARGFVFVLLEDETGMANVVIRPDLYEAERSVIRGESYLCVEGTVQLRSGSLNVIAERVSPLTRIPGLLLPQPAPRHDHPGRPDDPRDAVAAQAAGAADSAHPSLAALQAATPASHDFH
jgi:error-prone DNA polymerase